MRARQMEYEGTSGQTIKYGADDASASADDGGATEEERQRTDADDSGAATEERQRASEDDAGAAKELVEQQERRMQLMEQQMREQMMEQIRQAAIPGKTFVLLLRRYEASVIVNFERRSTATYNNIIGGYCKVGLDKSENEITSYMPQKANAGRLRLSKKVGFR
ncbi:hypothetical protein CJ030_MR7G000038 [Morella rubra]|uniref:Uncharacterized protein n=1 Tax=Morella rubra TaxID=262757 RepID=A0A6A1V2M8_9ROSI|nr:hypothetical protein CJ030_MR7G000038 [Morella rubra]